MKSPTSNPNNFAFSILGAQEGVGVGLVSTSRAQQLVPAPFRLTGAKEPVTPLVSLGYRGKLLIDGQVGDPVVIAMISLMIESPDGTGDINSYLLWHYTSNLALCGRLRQAGIPSQHAPQLRFVHEPDATATAFGLHVPDPGDPPFSLVGRVRPPADELELTANLWFQSPATGPVKIGNSLREGRFGAAALSLTTATGTPLSRLIGGTTLDLQVLQRFNQMEAALSLVQLVDLVQTGISK